jgi:hypothetical protein
MIATVLLLSSCGTGSFSNPFVQSLGVTLTPSTLTLTPGTTARAGVTALISSTGEAATGLTVTASDLPSGLTVSGSTGAVTVSAAKDVSPGVYSIPLTVSAPGARGTAQLAVTVPTPTTPGFTVTLDPDPVAVVQGTGMHVALRVTPEAGFTDPVVVTEVTGNLKTTIDPDGGGLTVQAVPSAVPGTYILTVTTQGGTVTHTSALTVTVTEATL